MNNSQTESSIRKVALTSLSGTSIEWYDFFLYGAAAGLVFPKLFFGEVDPTTPELKGQPPLKPCFIFHIN